ncbi:hypothetical protein [Acetobacterium tundrae]|uniref:Uncharacterized protein n=1 Tax=Acetobacterium tundrae TaxID=132932 RepID=A0ABR6WM03_9FIRM|nr:hypothetical protein [Acetobacterium tundrae]MBC3797157.1 hypothetical protein [Acetobacterium tundrae]
MQRGLLILKLEDVVAEMAKKNQGARTDLNIKTNSSKGSTRKQLAKEAGMGEGVSEEVNVMIPNIVNKSQAMKIYKIGGKKMLNLLQDPTCPAIKEGRSWVINLDAFWPWLMERKQKNI